jgi:hypothetical protein
MRFYSQNRIALPIYMENSRKTVKQPVWAVKFIDEKWHEKQRDQNRDPAGFTIWVTTDGRVADLKLHDHDMGRHYRRNLGLKP